MFLHTLPTSCTSAESAAATTPPNLLQDVEISILVPVSIQSDHLDPTYAIVTGLSRDCHNCHRRGTRTSKARLRPPPTILMVDPYLPDIGKPSRACDSPQLTELLPCMPAARVPPADRTIVVTDPARATQIPTTT